MWWVLSAAYTHTSGSIATHTHIQWPGVHYQSNLNTCPLFSCSLFLIFKENKNYFFLIRNLCERVKSCWIIMKCNRTAKSVLIWINLTLRHKFNLTEQKEKRMRCETYLKLNERRQTVECVLERTDNERQDIGEKK